MMLFCVHKNMFVDPEKLKFLVFEIPNRKNKNKKERTTLPSSPFREITKIDL